MPDIEAAIRSVLVVEDVESLRRFVTVMLERAGYAVLGAAGVAHAVQVANAHEASIDVILADVELPDGNGAVLARQLQSSNPNLKVILMSGHTEAELVESGDVSQDVVFLHKPFVMTALIESVRRALR